MSRISYHEAAIPEPWQILGLRLKPFCLGHYLHLARFNVAFVCEASAEATITDLVLAALVCSKSYEEFAAWIQKGKWRQMMTDWGEACGEFSLTEKIALMNAYIAQGSRQPAVIFEGTGEGSGAHWSQVLKVALIQMGYTKSQAMNLPLTEAFQDFYRDAESKGVLRMADPELAAALDEADAETPNGDGHEKAQKSQNQAACSSGTDSPAGGTPALPIGKKDDGKIPDLQGTEGNPS